MNSRRDNAITAAKNRMHPMTIRPAVKEWV